MRAGSPSQVMREYKKMKKKERAAYDQALRLIEEAHENGSKELRLWDPADQNRHTDLAKLPPEISNLKKLTYLDLSYTAVFDISPLRELSELTDLYLTNIDLEDISPLRDLKELRHLYLSSSSVRDITPLKDLNNLVSLYLSHTGVTDLSPLSKLKNLEDIFLDGLSINDLSEILKLNEIVSLSLTGTQISDLRPIQSFPKLAKLWFENTPIANATKKLKELSNIGANDDPDECARQTLAYLRSSSIPPEDSTSIILNVEDEKTPSSLRPRATKLKKILREDPAGFAAHVQNSVAMLQAARAREAMSIPNDPDALAEWKTLTTSLTVAEDTLTVLHELIPDAPIPDPSQQDVSALAAALEAAAAKLRSGCAYLDKSTKTENGHHFATLHKIGVCSAVGSVFAFAAGSTLLVTLPAIAAILYGKDFAKSATSIFKGGI
jgi:hypothetical protein